MPLSSRKAARQRQLDNLRPGPPAAKSNQMARRHGGYAEVAAERMEEKAREVFAALSADAPLREEGELPAADAGIVRLASECLCRIDTLSAYLAAHGVLDAKGNVLPAAELEGRLRREAADHLDAVGMTPRSRKRLQLDTVRAFDLAAHWQAEDERGADAEGEAIEEDGADA